MKPVRIQQRRIRGWRKPNGAISVVCGKGRRWGNPFTVKEYGQETAAELYREWLYQPEQARLRADARRTLAGHDLMCWCPLDQPCHADVLLELVNT